MVGAHRPTLRTPLPTDLHQLSATEMLDAFRDGSLSPVEVAAAVLDRIDSLDPTLNAFCLRSPDILADARASEERWRRGEPAGDLDGVPVTIKDVVLTRGWPTLRGSKTVDPAGPWDEDAPITARLRESGAVLLGKTTTPEFGWKGMTDSPLTGITRNPWAPARTAGGSSGGAAAAVGGGMGPLAVGTDGGGSIRIPAGFSGVFGLKPTFGVVPAWPLSPFGTVAHLGPMTRTVDDAALMLDVISRPDVRDWYAVPTGRDDYLTGLDAGVAGMRIAYSADLGYATVDPEVAAIVERAARAFEELGARVETADPGFEDPEPTFRVLWFAALARFLGKIPAEQHALMDARMRQEAEADGAPVTAAELIDAGLARAALGLHMNRFHETYDLLLTPTLPIPAFAADEDELDAEIRDRSWTSWTPFTFPFNLTQQPAASIPCGLTSEGLPVGLQIVGPKFADALVLRAARAYEAAHPFPPPPLG